MTEMPNRSSWETSGPKKQAVVLIHGIGEQRPMATLWQLVQMVWVGAPRSDGKKRAVYSEPDEHSGIFELRRLSTNENIYGKRTDFFEFYWAHLMHGNRFGHVMGWLARLAMRPRGEVPASLLKARRVLQAPVFLAAIYLLILALAGANSLIDRQIQAPFVSALAIAVAGWIALLLFEKFFLTPVVGDAARYLSREPGDIQRRQEIRASGLALLDGLHKCGKYDRIIIVAHSLGGVIGYDLITHLWGRRNRRMGREGPIQDALAKAEAAAEALHQEPNDPGRRADWRAAQRAVFDCLRDAPLASEEPLWLVSDFVTLGAPLAHAQTLMAERTADFMQSFARREHASNPPQFEHLGGEKRFTYCRTHGRAEDPHAMPRAPHNAAVFAAVRWTNVYFPAQGILRGDLVGGPAAPVFGPGVEDVEARAPNRGGFAPHLRYFDLEAEESGWGPLHWVDHRQALRSAIALEDDEACWSAGVRAARQRAGGDRLA